MSDSDKESFDEMVEEVRSILEENQAEIFWQQLILSIKTEAERRWVAKNDGPSNNVGGLRDQQMGENLLWLSEEFYPDKKIVVWAANIHNAKDMSSVIAPDEPDFSFTDYVTIGKVLEEMGSNDFYVISFTGLSGQWGRWFDASASPVTASSEGSIEYLLGQAGHNHTFLDLRAATEDGAWLHERLLAKPFGYVELEANWAEVTDGFFFANSISRATSDN